MRSTSSAVKNLGYVLTFSFCAIFCTATMAQEGLQTAEQIYKQIRDLDSLIQMEIKIKIDKGEMTYPFHPSSPNEDKSWKLKSALEQSAKDGDPYAMFYTALLKSDFADKLRGSSSSSEVTKRLSDDEYVVAMRLFKQAGEAGISSAYWNVALMYANGEGGTQSNLAAVEWYYKAGNSYLKSGDRERALASLEAIQKVSKNHELGKRLDAMLRKNAPK